MDKRYQVFISSTFKDLEDERKAIMEAILELDCFPAGMEMFPASDDEQFEYIKRVIDESDYYVLVVAGRYGSEAEDGKSYTEKEFEYALEKGMPVLVFVSEDIDNILVSKTDNDEKKKKKLIKFRNRVIDDRLARMWKNSDDLKFKVHSSLSKEFKVKPRTGWIRGDVENNESLLQQLNKTRQEYDNLKEKLEKLQTELIERSNFKVLEDKHIKVHYYKDINGDNLGEIELSISSIFTLLARRLYEEQGIEKVYFKEIVKQEALKKCTEENALDIEENDIFKLMVLFKRLGLIDDSGEFLFLEDKGAELLFDLTLKEL